MKSSRRTFWLECSACKQRNYRVVRSVEKRVEKLKIKKYCAYCKKHTEHIEVR